MLRRRLTIGTTAVLAALAVATGAAADDGQIRADMKDGRLDGAYSQQQLAEYLNNAMTQGYGNPVATPAPPASGVAGAQSPTVTPAGSAPAASAPAASAPAGVAGAQSPPLAEVGQTGTLPFTGFDLALLTLGGCLMLGLGLAARRLGRNN